MEDKYYIDLDVLSRRFDDSKALKILKEKDISAKIHGLISDAKIRCVCSKALKDETRPIRQPLKRGWLFELFKKPGFTECIRPTLKMFDLRDKLVRQCGFTNNQLMDALHVTIAACSKADFFVTFNVKDLIDSGRKKCIENFFQKELNHTIVISTPQKLSSLKQLGQY